MHGSGQGCKAHTLAVITHQGSAVTTRNTDSWEVGHLFLLQNGNQELSTRPMPKLSQLLLFGGVTSHPVAVI